MKIIITESQYKNIFKEDETYFSRNLPKEAKVNTKIFKGNNVIWYGKPETMVVVHKSQVYPREDNIFYPKKLKYVETLVKNSETPVEFETGYGMGNVIDMMDVEEQQVAKYEGRFESEYTNETPASTGDSELDEYIGDENYLENNYEISSDNLREFFEENRVKSLYKLVPIEVLKNGIRNLQDYDEFDEDDFEAIEAFLEFENDINMAIKNKSGDLGKFTIQVRDGNHRTFGSIAAGEEYIAIDLFSKEEMQNYKGYYKTP